MRLGINCLEINKSDIIDFIKRRFTWNCNWTNGNCFWFAHILNTRFPYLDIYYLPIKGHFIAGDGKCFYDWTGEIQLEEKPYLLKEIYVIDYKWWERLMRDCRD